MIRRIHRTIKSSQGVRQGDPLSALLFSLGLRPVFEWLTAHLESECQVLAHLDGLFVLSTPKLNAMDRIVRSVVTKTPIRLNASKV